MYLTVIGWKCYKLYDMALLWWTYGPLRKFWHVTIVRSQNVHLDEYFTDITSLYLIPERHNAYTVC